MRTTGGLRAPLENLKMLEQIFSWKSVQLVSFHDSRGSYGVEAYTEVKTVSLFHQPFVSFCGLTYTSKCDFGRNLLFFR